MKALVIKQLKHSSNMLCHRIVVDRSGVRNRNQTFLDNGQSVVFGNPFPPYLIVKEL